jgi:uncharacterized protein (TIGR02452 family)
MKRNIRAEKAQETLQIIEQGYYAINDRIIDLKNNIVHSNASATLYAPDAFENVFETVNRKLKALQYNTTITLKNTTVLQAAQQLHATTGQIGCLNFASAKNPGGGFLGGAMAQEESLALSSTLYPTLMKHFEMYEYNRGRSTFLYSDYMIYSPDVMVFRDDEGALLADPYPISFITSPAVNIGAMKNNRPEELELSEVVMIQRMDKVLGLFLQQGIKHLLLGAWGCGVFRNEPENIATYFSTYLLNDGKYARAFESITFAVFDRSKDRNNIAAFEKILTAGSNPIFDSIS